MIVTIRDLLISPYEIDVEPRNIILVKNVINEETGKKSRKVLGYYVSLGHVMTVILQSKIRDLSPDLDGQVVSLKDFLQHEKHEKEILGGWYRSLMGNSSFGKDELPKISAKSLHETLIERGKIKKKK